MLPSPWTVLRRHWHVFAATWLDHYTCKILGKCEMKSFEGCRYSDLPLPFYMSFYVPPLIRPPTWNLLYLRTPATRVLPSSAEPLR